MKLGIYSGTFDPIHEGHVLFAQVAIEQFGIDEVIFIPEEAPRYKTGVTDAVSRAAMIKLTTKESVNLHLFEHGEASHTVAGVLESVAKEYPDDEYFILMGSDVYRNIEKWGDRDDEVGGIDNLRDTVGFVVGIKDLSELEELREVESRTGLNTRFVEVPIKGLSSSKIRSVIKGGEEPKGLNDDVKEFIALAKLYASPGSKP